MAGEAEEDSAGPLLLKPQKKPDQEHDKRTGTLWTAVAHIITGVIGAGVLSLAWSIAQLGWVAGPLAMLLFAAITLVQSSLLADCYRSPDPEHGDVRNHHYMDAVRHFLGEKSFWICGSIQQLSLFGSALAYTITSASSMRAIQRSHWDNGGGDSSSNYMLLFGVIQIVFSQIPDFHEMAWLSALAAIMSFSYSTIAFGLGLAKVIGNGTIKGGIGGVPMASTSQKVWRISQAFGDVAYAYPYSVILLDIEDTLKSPPPENQTMKRANAMSIYITTFFYLCCGCFGYAAFGDEAPGNLLTGFGLHETHNWLIGFANACIVIHLVGGYQVYSQPVFSFADEWAAGKFPNSAFVNEFYKLRLPSFLPSFRLNLFRLCFRTAYVAAATGLAMFFPYFNQVLGVLGASFFWPIAIYFPVEMYFVQRRITSWSRDWLLLQGFSTFCLLLSIFAFVGSVEGLITEKLNLKS
ncbi:probable amino acid permease 7 [Zingiber officinale]|uniref:Amino acid transporter transmembrane domain-containing protein n=1 Tax=Zingiber officinale TaxID=94328 RepID=A0A8J5ETC5_ZINOF|nr:probable amino acid permease 7 [Zingiber officinale]KAG6474575.1 hypothetical protein ZIOFF_068513 [Zingiber officinale]